jgi:hypothetical protein
MAIEKLPAAPVNLSGGSLLSRQPSNIPEGGNMLGNVAEQLLRTAEPGLKVAAEKAALSDVAARGVVRGPDGNYITPPEPVGGEVYNAVYEKAINQAYTASMGYDFQMKADKIAADNYTDPDRAITLMEATLSGMTKGMDPRFVQSVTPLLQSELQQRAYGVRNRKASDDREAVIRTNTDAASAALASIEQYAALGMLDKVEFYKNEYATRKENLIQLNYFSEAAKAATDDRVALALLSGERRAEREALSKQRDQLEIARLTTNINDSRISIESKAQLYTYLPVAEAPEIEKLYDIFNDVPGIDAVVPIRTYSNGEYKVEEVTINAGNVKSFFPEDELFNDAKRGITVMHQKNVAKAAAAERAAEQGQLVIKLSNDINSGLLQKPTAKEQSIIDSLSESEYGEPVNYSDPAGRAKTVAFAAKNGVADSRTISFVETAANSNDLTVLRGGQEIYQALRFQTRGNVNLGPTHLDRMTSKTREIYALMDHFEKSPGMNDADRLSGIENYRKGTLPSIEEMRRQYEGTDQSFETTALARLKLDLGFDIDEDVFIPGEIQDRLFNTVRAFSLAGSPSLALANASKSVTNSIKKDPRSSTGIGLRSFDTHVPPNAIQALSSAFPVLAGREFGKDVVYEIVQEAPNGASTFRLILMEGKMKKAYVLNNRGTPVVFDPAVIFKKEKAPSDPAALTPAASNARQEKIDAAQRRKDDLTRALTTNPAGNSLIR